MSCKVTLKYDEPENTDLHMTLRLTLPAKSVAGTTKAVVKLFVDHYNKKHGESEETRLDGDLFHLKIVGGNHIDREAIVGDHIRSGDECYLMSTFESPKRREPAPVAAAPAAAPAVSSAPVGSKDGMLRCKNFGCQRMYDPNGEPQPCRFHKAAPVFHETAKWWSCCPDSKAYDFDEFMKIPGCMNGFCSNEGAAGGAKKFLGGCDLRADSAPIRLDADAPPDPRRKLTALQRGFVAIGVEVDLFDKVCQQLHQRLGGDIEKVCDELARRLGPVLTDLQ